MTLRDEMFYRGRGGTRRISLTRIERKQIKAYAKDYPIGSSFEVAIAGYGFKKIVVRSRKGGASRGSTTIRLGNKLLVVI